MTEQRNWENTYDVFVQNCTSAEGEVYLTVRDFEEGRATLILDPEDAEELA